MKKTTDRRGALAMAGTAMAGLLVPGLLLGRSREVQKAKVMSQTPNKTNLNQARSLLGGIAPGPQHWVGDGFFVHSLIHPQMNPEQLSPFLLLDPAPPRRFEPGSRRRGVGEHPHRGFETVTFAYQGEVEHRDSAGGGGRIASGDVQWMTAASGLVHEEKHSEAFTATGGVFEMVQLWVNLPASQKMSEPAYQGLVDADFPRLELGAATARLVAGSLAGRQGPATTRTPITLMDLRFDADGVSRIELPTSWTTLVFPLEGDLKVGPDKETLPAHHLGVFVRESDGDIVLHGASGDRVVVLAGKPLEEPVAAHGPFVMNTREELQTAMDDYSSGRMGRLGS